MTVQRRERRATGQEADVAGQLSLSMSCHTHALLPSGDAYREEIVTVIDTGKRKMGWVEGHYGDPIYYDLALVIVAGESSARWIAVERLEPKRGTPEHMRWLAEIGPVQRPSVGAGRRRLT